ncbi:MAG: V-type ATPase subunit [Candidatus Hydrogenedentes bacterium]|nr:V-type ATPase subunit [Candidatus Hydrogenedentota bacterium]
MRTLTRYAETNVVTRAMLSALLTQHDFDALIRSSSVSEAWELLRKTEFGPLLPDGVPRDPLGLEQCLHSAAATRFQRSIRRLHGRASVVGDLLLSRWDLDNLEFVLRLWHGKEGDTPRLSSLSHFVHDIPFPVIGEAQSIKEVITALRGTPYASPLTDASSAYQEKHSVFYLETALERDHYRRLLAATAALGGADARTGMAIACAEIDMLNLAWIARQMQYPLAPHDAATFIPGPTELSRELSAPGLTAEKLAELGDKHLKKVLPGSDDARSGLQRIALLEEMLGEMAAASALRQFVRYPFTIGCVFSFYILVRLELKNLCAVFAGKAAGVGERDIEARIHGGR